MISGLIGIVALLRSVESNDVSDIPGDETRKLPQVWAGEIFTQLMNSSYDKRIRPPNYDAFGQYHISRPFYVRELCIALL
ncbi:hypothetical protein NECAME_13504 [Necator americanus]|uniref:Uncharacterized protein n=1 Tax=Necator americanus TaxID=51031 RepID=W2SXB2_NECAM|nr:hypothetical protein NECAME_13504 [Necator americanus]ETN73501.1 hypothetical protein NECAME_13504 [Necator americanus]